MQNLVITNKGQELMAKMIAGTSTATFTKICTSDFDYANTNLEQLQEMQNIKQEVFISNVSITDLTMVEVRAAIDNSKLTNGYYVRGLGLYAKDSDNVEILYGISIESKNPDYMPAFGGKTVSAISYTLNTKVNNAKQVTLEIKQDIYVDNRTFQETVQRIDTDLEGLKDKINDLGNNTDNIGQATDTDGQPTVFGKIADLKKLFSEKAKHWRY